MSDSDFDKEAEREKLREKYANERQDREATQRMSDLLLQGATMTNRHCDRCGDPVFRYDGQEFCPSCQSVGEASSADGQSLPEESSASGETSGAETAARAVADDERADPVDTGSQPSEIRERGSEADPEPERSDGSAQTATEPRSTESDLAGAREELGRTIATLARRASESEDPRRARELLEAADEAAKTLPTLDRR